MAVDTYVTVVDNARIDLPLICNCESRRYMLPQSDLRLMSRVDHGL